MNDWYEFLKSVLQAAAADARRLLRAGTCRVLKWKRMDHLFTVNVYI